MGQVRLLTGRFLKRDGEAIQDFEDIAAGTVTSIPALTGIAGCSLDVGNFISRDTA